MVGGALAHLIMYGTRSPYIPGIKELLYPPKASVSFARAIATEFCYGTFFFTLMVGPYRYFLKALDLRGWGSLATFAMAWFCAVCGYILFVGRYTIDDANGVALRGMLSAVAMEICLMLAAVM
jgi:hypothetical protein